MPDDPVIVVAGTNEYGPASPVRIANWTEFIAAIAANLQSTNLDHLQFDTTPIEPLNGIEGYVNWNETDKTLNVYTGGHTVIQVGQETLVRVRNNTGVAISNGSAVRFTQALGGRPLIALARADIYNNACVCGLATNDIPHNSDGFVTVRGLVRGINTADFAEGGNVFLSTTTAGGMQGSPPTTGFIVKVGICLVQNPGNGIIYVDPKERQTFGNMQLGNYSMFEPDGTLVSMGLARCYRDEFTSLLSTRLTSPAGDIVLNDAEASITMKTSARYPTDFLTMNIQLNHDWALGTSLGPHIHWWQTTTNTPNFLMGYRWQKENAAKTTSWTLAKWATTNWIWSSGTLNQITLFSDIPAPSGYGQVSDIVQVKLWRDYTNVSTLFAGSDPVAANQDILHFDVHLNVDMLGSRAEYQK